jgi:ribonucleoside-diphosphate reductase alpha chain
MDGASTLHLTPNALKVLERRYLRKDEEGRVVETAEELFRRVAKAIASADSAYGRTKEEVQRTADEFFEMMTTLLFLPNSPTLMNAGRPLGQLSACFVLPVGDSMDSIFDAVKSAAIIHKSGGGTGFSFSRLRPSGDVVGSTKGISSGPVSFMTVFDTATEAVKQGGTRRGANMGLLRVDHPDILDFIACKDHSKKLNNFNISVGITEDFMKAVEADGEYDLRNPRSGKVTGRLKAREVFDKVVRQAWKNGEPGIVFLDRINAANPTPQLGEIESTNPCGEQPLLPFESCNLGSINLARMVALTDQGTPTVNWAQLKDVTWKSVHFLDNVIEVNKYPLEEIDRMTRGNRKIGLGVMGWADMLIQLGIPYNSDEAIRLGEEVMAFIQTEGRIASSALSEERGVFANFKGSIFDGEMSVRNATVTTIAPTGTLSILAGCSSGIEPLFAVCYVRNVMEGTKLVECNPFFEQEAKLANLWNRDLMERVAEQGSIAHFEEFPEPMRRIFVTAHDITPVDHVRMQAAFQKYTDNAVSKTVNFPHDATVEEVEEVYKLSYRLACKGVTVYRDGSREDQVLSTTKKEEVPAAAAAAAPATPGKILPKNRPSLIRGATRSIRTGCGKLYITINEDADGKPFEAFTNIGKAGGCAASQAEAIGRLISLALRSNIAPDEIVKQLRGITCHQPSWSEGGRVNSCSDAIAQALESYMPIGVPVEENGNGGKSKYKEAVMLGACPDCGGSIQHVEGCAKCINPSCGYSQC